MQIESPAFKNNQALPKKYTCDGESINPPFLFRDIPAEAKSLALVVEDPDVPLSIRSDGMFDHWLIWNIPPDTELVEEGIPPAGTFGRNTRGTEKYIAPCPPDREHRYFFKLFALDINLPLPEGSSKAELLSAMEGHIINEAEIIGTYNRSR